MLHTFVIMVCCAAQVMQTFWYQQFLAKPAKMERRTSINTALKFMRRKSLKRGSGDTWYCVAITKYRRIKSATHQCMSTSGPLFACFCSRQKKTSAQIRRTGRGGAKGDKRTPEHQVLGGSWDVATKCTWGGNTDQK